MSNDTWTKYCDAVHKLRELEGSRRKRVARVLAQRATVGIEAGVAPAPRAVVPGRR